MKIKGITRRKNGKYYLEITSDHKGTEEKQLIPYDGSVTEDLRASIGKEVTVQISLWIPIKYAVEIRNKRKQSKI